MTPGGCASSNLLFFAGLFLVLYFVFLRPTRAARAVKPGDEVATQAGLVGKVVSVDAQAVTLEVSQGVTVRVQPGSVERR